MLYNKLLYLSVFLWLATTSCNRCEDVTCNEGYACDKGECIRVTDVITGDDEEDPCSSSTCFNGECKSGVCECDDYWFGEACDTAANANYINSYTGDYICPGVNRTFTYYFAPGSDPQEIFLSDSNGTDLTGTIKVDDFDRFTINPQNFFDSTNTLYSVRGFGERIGEDMNITLIIDPEDSESQTCGFTGKQN